VLHRGAVGIMKNCITLPTKKCGMLSTKSTTPSI
jgi:hypothetical protein